MLNNNSISKNDWQYILSASLLISVFIITDLIGLFDKDRPESTLIRVVYSLMWILIPLIILYYFYKDLITSFIER